MAHTSAREVSFGAGKAALLTVGYQLVNTDGTLNGSRLTTGVVELAGGAYGAPISFPDGFRGFVKWDTGEGSPVYAAEAINPETDENADVKTSTVAATTIAAQVAAGVLGSKITMLRGETWVIVLTGLGTLAGRSKLYFTVKAALDDADTAAIIQVEESGGLLRLMGAAGTSNQAALVVNDATAGNITITVAAVAAALVPPATYYHYDVQKIVSSVVTTVTMSDFIVTGDATRATS